MAQAEKIQIGRHEVLIDPNNLKFDEATLDHYLQIEGGWYDNFGTFLALAERYLALKDAQYDQLYSERFVENKDEGGSDKYAEAKTKADQDVVDLKKQVADAKYKVNRLKLHIRAWDKNHDNAQSTGHMLRKQIDKLREDRILEGKQLDNEVVKRVNDDPVTSVEQVDNSGGFEEVNASNLF